MQENKRNQGERKKNKVQNLRKMVMANVYVRQRKQNHKNASKESPKSKHTSFWFNAPDTEKFYLACNKILKTDHIQQGIDMFASKETFIVFYTAPQSLRISSFHISQLADKKKKIQNKYQTFALKLPYVGTISQPLPVTYVCSISMWFIRTV